MQRPWRVAVDTGGTFTDCLAIDPRGLVHRAKVLSSGAIRARLVAGPSDGNWTLSSRLEPPDGFFAGWRVRKAGSRDRGTLIEHSTGDEITVVGPPDDFEGAGGVGTGEGFEVELYSDEDAATVATRMVTRTVLGTAYPPTEVRLATTRGTNALLERKGAPVGLFITQGFGDLLEIGTQQRPDLFALDIRKPAPLYSEVVEVRERTACDGSEVVPLEEEQVEIEGRRMLNRGVRSAAVVFLHAYREPAHELAAGQILRAAGFDRVALSSDLSRRIRMVPRGRTAVVEAYLAEIVGSYLEEVERSLAPRSVHVLTSAGGLTRAHEFRAKDSLLSGPAGGVVGAAVSGELAGAGRVIAFDMGGTSTDVSRCEGELELRDETRVADALLLSPSVAVETVAAGGGSVCWFDGERIRVGPQSAGAVPGPACYGGGGPLTLTDVNLLLGRLVASRFPFGVDRQAAATRAAELGADAGRAGPVGRSPGGTRDSLELDELLAGFLTVANERMAGAIRRISIRRGYDPSEHTLVAFGGAGAQHACALASLLGIGQVLVPRDGALLSALGLSVARIERRVDRQVFEPLVNAQRLADTFETMAAEATEALEAEGVAVKDIQGESKTLFLRYAGQQSTLALVVPASLVVDELAERFETAYRDVYGYLPEGREIEVESLRLELRAVPPEHRPREAVPMPPIEMEGVEGEQSFWDGRGRRPVPVLDRGSLAVDRIVEGPCLITEQHTVTVLEPCWRARAQNPGGLLLETSS